MSQIIYWKVLDEDLKSLGLKPKKRPVPIIQYKIGEWTRPAEKYISQNPDKGGGLWVTPRRSEAIKIAKYMWRKYRRKVRVFSCFIGKCLCQPSYYRLKTEKVMLREEIILEFYE